MNISSCELKAELNLCLLLANHWEQKFLMLLIAVYSSLLIFGFIFAQTLIDNEAESMQMIIHSLAAFCLSYIMLGVGIEFRLPKKNTLQDHSAAILGSLLPWVLCSIYFFFFFQSSGANWWKECLLLGCFAAPTSAGILFSMLEAGGLAKTWVFKKSKLLAVLDDLYTLILLVPIRLLNFGFSPQLFLTVGIIFSFFGIGWKFNNKFKVPHSSHFRISYAALITAGSYIAKSYGVEIDVLIPSFVLGGIIKEEQQRENPSEWLEKLFSSGFMLLVGASMPPILHVLNVEGNILKLTLHVLIITQIANIGKFVSACFYQKEASIKERIALAISMLPRGEVGAGVIMLASAAGIQEEATTVAVISLALNLFLTGGFIQLVCKLARPTTKRS